MPIILICQSLSYKTTPPAILPLDRLQPSSTIRGSWSPRSSRTTPPWKWFGQSSPPWSCCPSRSHLSHSSTPWISTPTVQVGDPVCVCVCVCVYVCVCVCVCMCGVGGLGVCVCCWVYFMITTSCAWCVAGCIRLLRPTAPLILHWYTLLCCSACIAASSTHLRHISCK